jgi:hypothetical protein
LKQQAIYLSVFPTTDILEYITRKKMRILLGFSMLLMLSLFSCNKEDTDPIPENNENEPPETFSIETGNSKVPYIIIDTEGVKIENEPKVPAKMYIFQEKELVQLQTIGIEYRGSTSFRLSDKKSYGIETWDQSGNDVNVSFFGFPEEEDWILQGHVVNLEGNYIFDRTLLYHYLGYNWSRSIGRYASRTQLVELELNEVYQGVYVFMEKLKRDGERIDLKKLEADDTDITGGYILKIDKTAGGDHTIGQPLEYYYTNWEDDARYTEENSFRSYFDFRGDSIPFFPFAPPYHPDQYLETYFLYEYPKAEEITQGQKEYISDYIYRFERALLDDDFGTDIRTYTDYIDVDSFVDYLLLTELARNVDGYRLSTYLTKDRGSKLAMGPIWDLNIGFDSGDRIPWDGWVYNYNSYVSQDAWMVHFWWTRLMSDPLFKLKVKSRWQELRAGPFATSVLHRSIDEAKDYLKENQATDRNYVRWEVAPGVDYEASIQGLKDYIDFRTEWMDGAIGGF